MKIKAGNDVDIKGDVTKGEKESPFWVHFREIAWFATTVSLIAATVILYVVTNEIEVADIFAGLIGVAIGALSRDIVQQARGIG